MPAEITVLGPLSDFPDGAAAPASYRNGGREVAALVVRRTAGDWPNRAARAA